MFDPQNCIQSYVTNTETDEHKYYYGISDTPFKERYENHKTPFRHRSHLTTSDLSKHYWKLVDNSAVPTIKFPIAKGVKGNTFIDNYNLCLSEKTFITRNLDDTKKYIYQRRIKRRVKGRIKKRSRDV